MLRWIRDKIRLRRRVSARWNVLRLNRWIRLRKAGVSREAALTRSFFFSAEALFDVIEQGLNGALSQVGILSFGGGSFSGGGSGGQITLLLRMMIDLSELDRWTESAWRMPAMAAKTKAILDELQGHNWGLVRGAVEAARAKKLAA